MSVESMTSEVSERDRKAATEAMVVVRHAPGMYVVYSGATSVYTVDAVGPACECEDFRFRHAETDSRCKHIRRCEMTAGVRPIPDGVDPDPVLIRQRDNWMENHDGN